MKTILYLTDLYYEAKGRKYYEEDLYITSKLKDHFNILIGHPQQALSFLNAADMIVFRNTGPVIYYQDYFQQFVKAVHKNNAITFNSFDGKGDAKGKSYLLELTNLGFPVIPTVDKVADVELLGNWEKYMVKLKTGSDSIGMQELTKDELFSSEHDGKLIQPYLDLEYEVSFYYLNNTFQYALYAPDKQKRWALVEYEATPEDLKFADRFIYWNNMQRGITRVDAGRLKDSSLLLVELEDLNPFLSIALLKEEKRNEFLENWKRILKDL